MPPTHHSNNGYYYYYYYYYDYYYYYYPQPFSRLEQLLGAPALAPGHGQPNHSNGDAVGRQARRTPPAARRARPCYRAARPARRRARRRTTGVASGVLCPRFPSALHQQTLLVAQ